MLNCLRRLRRRWFGPTTREILWMIHVDLSALSEMSSYLIKGVDQVGRMHAQHKKAAHRIWQAEVRMAEFLDKMNGEPFMALKKWLDECTKSNGDFVEQRREFIERERQLLSRWKNQVEQVADSSL